MDELQLEEQQKNIQQTQDRDSYDSNASLQNPDGNTTVGEGEDNTQVEQVDSINVGEVEVTNPQEEVSQNGDVFGSSGDFSGGIDSGNGVSEVEEQFQGSSVGNVPIGSASNDIQNIEEDSDIEEETVAESPASESPEDPEDPDPEDPEDPDPEDPDPEDPDPEDPDPEDPDPEDPDPEDPDPEDPDPEDPDPEDPDPEDPDPEDPDPEDPDPEDPDPEDPDPEDPDPEDPGRGNPGNDKEVGNSPWDGETGASDNPGKGKHQDGEDPETNQPPGDSKNDGGQGNNPEDDGDNEGDVPERGQNNGWGNGDDDAPGNSESHNNAENDETPGRNHEDFIEKFIENHSFNDEYDNREGNLDLEYDNYQPEDLGDVIIPDVSEPVFDFGISDFDSYNETYDDLG